MIGYSKEALLATDFQSITRREDLAASKELLRKLAVGEADDCRLEKR